MMYPLTSGGSTTLSVTGIRRYRAVMANSLPRRCPDTLINKDHLSEKLTRANRDAVGFNNWGGLLRRLPPVCLIFASGGSRAGPDYPARWIWFSITEADMAHLW